MAHINFEFKARTADIDLLEQRLQTLNPEFRGEDHQVDTYFNSPTGRLKLREGNIEYSLIHYEREDNAAAKQSNVILYHPPTADPNLKAILAKTLGIKIIVDKIRRIYFIGNVKFHFDRVEGLGNFVEVEAIDKDGSLGVEKLQMQCNRYAELFDIQPDDYLAGSYSDMLMHRQGESKQAAGK